jgi:hypothetical protein
MLGMVGFYGLRRADIGQKRTSDCVRGKKAFGKIWSAKPQAIWKSALDRIDGTKNWSIRGVEKSESYRIGLLSI